MAQLTALELLNDIQLKNGVDTSTALTDLTGLDYKLWTWLNESIVELATMEEWTPLEKTGTITLANGTNTYAVASDAGEIDKRSFRYDESKNLEFYSSQEIDYYYVTQTNSGTPDVVYRWGDYFKFNNIPGSGENGKEVSYRYWQIPATLSTSTSSGVSWVPEPWDRLVLTNMVCYKGFQYRHNEEYKEYKRRLFGDRQYGDPGLFNKMRDVLRSPQSDKIRIVRN
jgi:hypothetical protein